MRVARYLLRCEQLSKLTYSSGLFPTDISLLPCLTLLTSFIFHVGIWIHVDEQKRYINTGLLRKAMHRDMSTFYTGFSLHCHKSISLKMGFGLTQGIV